MTVIGCHIVEVVIQDDGVIKSKDGTFIGVTVDKHNSIVNNIITMLKNHMKQEINS